MKARRRSALATLDPVVDTVLSAPPPVTDADIAHALHAGDFATLNELIGTGKLQPDAEPVPGMTPLIAAALSNNTTQVFRLSSAGARVNFETSTHVNAVMEACKALNLLAVESMFRYGAVHAPTRTGETPLVAAVLADFISSTAVRRSDALDALLDLLLVHGGDVNQMTRIGSPLLVAVRLECRLAVEALLARGADVGAQDANGCTPLIAACETGRRDIARLLLRHGARVDAETSSGKTALTQAALRGDAGIIAELLAHGATPDRETGLGYTPLTQASRAGAKAAIHALLLAGADVNWETACALTPLLAATRHNRIPAAEALLRKGARVNHEAADGMTALIVAVKLRNLELVRTLLEAGATPGYETASGCTALDVAADLQRQQPAVGARILEALAQHQQFRASRRSTGADRPSEAQELDEADRLHELKSDLQGHIERDQLSEAIRLLRSIDEASTVNALVDMETAQGFTAVMQAIGLGDVVCVKALLLMHADPNHVTRDHYTPLMWAAAQRQLRIVDLLLEHGAEVNLETDSGRNALIEACYWGLEDVVIHLLHRGANPSYETKSGWTPLTQAAARGHVGVALLLLQSVDVDQENRLGSTALIWACRRRHHEMVALLLRAGANPRRCSRNGALPLREARAAGNARCVAQLVAASCPDLAGAVHEQWRFMSTALAMSHWKRCTWRLGLTRDMSIQRPEHRDKSMPCLRSVPVLCMGLTIAMLGRGAAPQQSTDADVARPGKHGEPYALAKCAARAEASLLFVKQLAMEEVQLEAAQLIRQKYEHNTEQERKGCRPLDFPDLIRSVYFARHFSSGFARRKLQALAVAIKRFARESGVVALLGRMTGALHAEHYDSVHAEHVVEVLGRITGTAHMEEALIHRTAKVPSMTAIEACAATLGKEFETHHVRQFLRIQVHSDALPLMTLLMRLFPFPFPVEL